MTLNKKHAAAIIALITSYSLPSIAGEPGLYIGLAVGNAVYDIDNSETADDITDVLYSEFEDTGTSANFTDVTTDINDNDTSLQFKIGFNVNEFLALEFAYTDFGSTKQGINIESAFYSDPFGLTYDTLFDINLNETLDSSSFSFAAIGKIPISEKFYLYGKLGIEAWTVDSKIQGGGSIRFLGPRGRLIDGFEFDINDLDDTDNSETFSNNDLFVGFGATYVLTDNIDINLNYDIHSWEDNGFELEHDNLSLGLNYNF